MKSVARFVLDHVLRVDAVTIDFAMVVVRDDDGGDDVVAVVL